MSNPLSDGGKAAAVLTRNLKPDAGGVLVGVSESFDGGSRWPVFRFAEMEYPNSPTANAQIAEALEQLVTAAVEGRLVIMLVKPDPATTRKAFNFTRACKCPDDDLAQRCGPWQETSGSVGKLGSMQGWECKTCRGFIPFEKLKPGGLS